jgi:anti-sigma regulatory factor (Ser/Thr protein kinase)
MVGLRVLWHALRRSGLEARFTPISGEADTVRGTSRCRRGLFPKSLAPVSVSPPPCRESQVSTTAERAAVPRTRWVSQSILAVGALPTATPRARLHARNVLCDWGLRDMADTVELVVSELVTNAVQASMDQSGRPRYNGDGRLDCVRVRLASDGTITLVEVWDENPGLPALTQTTDDDDSGRGLMLVDALSEQWGWDTSRHGGAKVVWALIGR